MSVATLRLARASSLRFPNPSLTASARPLHVPALPPYPLGVSLKDPETYTAKRENGVRLLLAQGYPFPGLLEHRIAWRDHDQFQHVNNKHALAHFEDGRAVWLASIAAQCSEETQRAWRGGGKGIGPILPTTWRFRTSR